MLTSTVILRGQILVEPPSSPSRVKLTSILFFDEPKPLGGGVLQLSRDFLSI